MAIGIYVVALVVAVVGLDILVLRHDAWVRLLAILEARDCPEFGCLFT